MKRHFSFEVDNLAREYCENIVSRMVELFRVSEDEALGRINRHWAGHTMQGDDDLLYHQTIDDWASDIYYGAGSSWWTKPIGLKPLPYP